MPVIAICSLKGGTGKSTIALNLGSILSEEKRKVLVLDADPNGSIANWQEIRKQDKPEILVEPKPVIHIDKRIEVESRKFDIVIIDTPPYASERVRTAINAANRLIIPIVPGVMDLWRIERLLKMYRRAKSFKPRLDARLLISRMDRRTRVGRELRRNIENIGLELFNTEIVERVVYGKAWIAGITADKLDPGGLGAKDFKRLAREVLNWIKLP